jgi:hypothetical protein
MNDHRFTYPVVVPVRGTTISGHAVPGTTVSAHPAEVRAPAPAHVRAPVALEPFEPAVRRGSTPAREATLAA